MTEASARDALDAVGLSATIEWVEGDAADAFLVSDETPVAGTLVDAGTAVVLKIVKYVPPGAPSGTPPTPPPGATKVLMPNLIGLTSTQADELLVSLNLNGNPVFVSNGSVAPLRVFSQQIVPGDVVDVGTWATYRVSLPPPPPAPIPVPNFYGKTKAQALGLAFVAGLDLHPLFASAPTKPAYRVYSQSVAAYAIVPIGTSITVWIAEPPPRPRSRRCRT